MKSSISILKLLLGNKKEKFTIRHISLLTGINYRIAYEKVIELQKESLIKVSEAGNSKLCELTFNFNNKVFDAEYSRRLDLFKKKDFLVIYNRLSELTFPFIALLFGSYAKGKASKNSDIDILAIGGNQKEIASVIRLLPDKIHLISTTYEEFISMAKSREFTVVEEAIKNNIVLIGIEEYYRLLGNVNY